MIFGCISVAFSFVHIRTEIQIHLNVSCDLRTVFNFVYDFMLFSGVIITDLTIVAL